MRIVTVILARGGSKRIPQKLLTDFCGRKLVEWTVEDAILLGYPVFLYTDDSAIKKIAESYSINVRPKLYENVDGKHETAKELKEYNKEYKADIIILLQGTSPLRDVDLMKSWVYDFIDSDYDCGLSAYALKKYVYDDTGLCLNVKDRTYNKTVKSYCENGSFYIFRKENIENEHIFSGKTKIYEDTYDIDIDYPIDLFKAKLLIDGGYYEIY